MMFSTLCGVVIPIPMFALIDVGNPWLTLTALLVCFVCAAATSYVAQAAFLPELFPPASLLGSGLLAQVSHIGSYRMIRLWQSRRYSFIIGHESHAALCARFAGHET